MTDYLEKHLGSAEALLKRVRQLEQSGSGRLQESVPEENMTRSDHYDKITKKNIGESDIVSEKDVSVYDSKKTVNQQDIIVDDSGLDRIIREKEQDTVVNYYIKEAYDRWEPGKTGTASRGEEGRTGVEQAEHRSALSAQLEDLDRAASALTVLLPGSRGTARGNDPVFLSQGPAADPNLISLPDGAWNGPGTAVSADFAYGGKQSWAEQADRIFRRDSRRYDGGFYLY